MEHQPPRNAPSTAPFWVKVFVQRLSTSSLATGGPCWFAEPGPDLDAVVAALVQVCETAEDHWRGAFHVERVDFVAFVADHLTGSLDGLEANRVVERLRQLFAADLLLALACSQGNRRAHAILEERYLPSALRGLRGGSNERTGEVLQAIRERILAAPASGVPRIAQYRGNGPLGAWLRMIATRCSVDARRSDGPAHDPLPDVAALAADPEVLVLKQRYAEPCRRALSQALEALSDRDHALLRLHFVEGMTTALLATMYRVSVRTVQRWLGQALEDVRHGVRTRLVAELGLAPRDVESLLHMVMSRVSAGLQRGAPDHPGRQQP